MSTLEQLNVASFLLINANPNPNPNPSAWMLGLSRFLAQYLSFLIPILLIYQWLYGNKQQSELVLMSCMTVALSMCFNWLILHVFPHPRPFMLGLGTNFMHHGAEPSFPSDHMSTASAMAWVYLMARRWVLGVVFAMLALSVGWVRVYLGVHFPFDILGSIFVSLCGALIVFRIWARWGTRIITPVERLYRKLSAAPIRRGWFRP